MTGCFDRLKEYHEFIKEVAVQAKVGNGEQVVIQKTDTSLLAQFYHADEELNLVAAELDSFDGHKDPERCTRLFSQLHGCQDRLLNVVQKVMEDAIPGQRADRDFRVKFPDDVLQDSLAGQLWFGAECLAAGSSILNREVESASMRPLSRALTKNLDTLRALLRDQCLCNGAEYNDRIKEALVIFDKLFAEFELSYVSAMVPVKTMKEYDMLQEVTVLFSETVQSGLLICPKGPLNLDMDPTNMTEMYRPFKTVLLKIRELLYTLSVSELALLEKALSNSEDPEVSTHKSVANQSDSTLASQSDLPVQVDQGFHEGGKGIVQVDTFISSDPAHVSESPDTTVNLDLDLQYLDFNPISSTKTFMENMSDSVIDNWLNQSERQDSGLYSENISTSDAVTIDCVPVASVDIDGLSVNSVIAGDSDTNINDNAFVENAADMLFSQMSDITHCDHTEDCDSLSAAHYCCNTGILDNVSVLQHLCREIVDDIVINAMHYGDNKVLSDVTCVTSTLFSLGNLNADVTDSTNNFCTVEVHVTGGADDVSDRLEVLRQFSWQHNIQLAHPQLLLSPEDHDRNLSGVIVSENAMSDSEIHNESMADFVVETLANINNPRACIDTATISKADACTNVHDREHNIIAQTSEFTDSEYKQSVSISSTSLPVTHSTLSCTNNHMISNKPKLVNTHRSHRTRSAQNLNNIKELQHDHVQNIKCEAGTHVEDCTSDSNGATVDMQINTLPSQAVLAVKSVNISTSSSSSSCQSSDSECEISFSCARSETSSYTSEMNDEEEIALAIEAADVAPWNEARARFHSSSDMIHRLFVCIAGVADQLLTNYAGDLRQILKCVFYMNASLTDQTENKTKSTNSDILTGRDNQVLIQHQLPINQQSPRNQSSHSNQSAHRNRMINEHSYHHRSRPRLSAASSRRIPDEPPQWVPDDEVEICTTCKLPFTFVRRRHHCRKCGKIFCGQCSSTTMPLPQYGHQKPVRVCHQCFIDQISHLRVTGDF